MQKKIIESLSSFDFEERKKAVEKISKLIKAGIISKYEKQYPYDNMHLHSFHSFNYKNWSPSRIIFEAYLTGLNHAGIVDFDTLEAIEETHLASTIFGVPALCGLESRVYIPSFAKKVINSPGEPGVYYINGFGFKSIPKKGSESARIYQKLHEIAEARNRSIIKKLNEYLSPVKIDYEKDVFPLTPSKNPTERHIIKAYIEKTEKINLKNSDLFWADIIKMNPVEIKRIKDEKPGDFMEKIRSVLVKSGGPGYVRPAPNTFPTIYEFIKMTEESSGIAIGNWLDGTNDGEKNPEEFLEFMISTGIRIINIIPERNWNIANPEEKKKKVANLDSFLYACKKMNIPVICGTEMNKYGQPFVDNFETPELKKHLSWFESSVKKLFLIVNSS
ncbi:MAG: hypothetical protein NC831_06850 [Candidatus Omnitrophica bacterium]|nr:hypothetical protein [Candidatus Omnitrophota bacterium]MCM8828221.1 hypothetical protein [Candidatus Omnitrophota bacterium]